MQYVKVYFHTFSFKNISESRDTKPAFSPTHVMFCSFLFFYCKYCTFTLI